MTDNLQLAMNGVNLMRQSKRYIKVFIKALIMTLHGEKPKTDAEKQYPHLFEWLYEGQLLINRVYKLADKNQFDETQRRACTIKVDGRDMSMELILASIRHHLTKEYVYLLKDFTNHSVTGIYALNLNDHYWVTRLIEEGNIVPPIKEKLAILADHLAGIPSNTDPIQS